MLVVIYTGATLLKASSKAKENIVDVACAASESVMSETSFEAVSQAASKAASTASSLSSAATTAAAATSQYTSEYVASAAAKAASTAATAAGLDKEFGLAVDNAGRGALKTTALAFPLVMLVFFGLIAMWFKSQGGYKPVILDEEDGGDGGDNKHPDPEGEPIPAVEL